MLCPVAVVLAYMAVRGPGSGPFFRFNDGTPLTRAKFVVKVREALKAAKVDYAPYFQKWGSDHSCQTRSERCDDKNARSVEE